MINERVQGCIADTLTTTLPVGSKSIDNLIITLTTHNK